MLLLPPPLTLPHRAQEPGFIEQMSKLMMGGDLAGDMAKALADMSAAVGGDSPAAEGGEDAGGDDGEDTE